MKVFVTGGTGFLGTTLTQRLTGQGYEVSVLTRAVPPGRTLPQGAVYLEGDPTRKGPWQDRVAEHEIVVNLAGKSIFERWTEKNKEAIRESRILTTQNLVEGLSSRRGQETVLISASAVGYYGFRGDEELDETSAAGDDFLASLAREWEAAAKEAERYDGRVILCRLGILLGAQGGALGMMLPTFKRYMGAPLGSGNQWFSWIHEKDLANIYLFLIEHKEISGPVNCTAPHTVRNREMTKILAEVLGRPAFMPAVPGFVLKMMMGEFGSVLLKGQKVLPKKLMEAGFQFQYPQIREALEDLVAN